MIRLTDPDKIGEALRDLRAMLGLTQAKMAELLGTYQGRYSEYETGAVVPSLASLISMFKRIDFDLAMVGSIEGGSDAKAVRADQPEDQGRPDSGRGPAVEADRHG